MRLYEYLIGGKKTGRIDDLKDVIPDSKPFCELKEGDTFFVSLFKSNGTRVYVDEVKITSIRKEHTYWEFSGFVKNGLKCTHFVGAKDLDKKLDVWEQRTHYKVYSTFKMDDAPLFELVKKEIEN